MCTSGELALRAHYFVARVNSRGSLHISEAVLHEHESKELLSRHKTLHRQQHIVKVKMTRSNERTKEQRQVWMKNT